ALQDQSAHPSWVLPPLRPSVHLGHPHLRVLDLPCGGPMGIRGASLGLCRLRSD
ncbi:hypothetical protein FRC11_005460, partial [Ceratobasidium sp. 423]